MNKRKAIFMGALTLILVASAYANNLMITNVNVRGFTDTKAYLSFDVSWDNSWRYENSGDPLYFHDAAWIFFKVKVVGGNEWQHVIFENSGLNPVGSSCGQGAAVEIMVPDDRVGLFLRRAADGNGPVSVQNIEVIWDITANGLLKTDQVRLKAFGLEMVYVPEGAFQLGDGATGRGNLFEGGGGTTPFTVEHGGAIECANQAGCLWGASQASYTSMGGAGDIPAEFPNGFNAFYCMKYEVTQGQYVDFLNTLTRLQQQNHCLATVEGYYMSSTAGGSASAQYRNTVQLIDDSEGVEPRIYATATPDRVCNFFSYADLAALCDWSGLRIMTELEFEKACRGPLAPVTGEYAWGTSARVTPTGLQGTDGSGEEYYNTGNLVCAGAGPGNGPVRAGIFAKPGASREQAGASYWGIMELSGNMWERVVTIGHASGRDFTGLHGNGCLSADGAADVANWPSASATGTGVRGGGWTVEAQSSQTSDRNFGARALNERNTNWGGRAVRSAP